MRLSLTAYKLLSCSGAGWAEQQQLSAHVDVSVGTFSKAFGCHGGFVAGSAALITFLTNRGRPYVFSTALPAPVAAAALAALRVSQRVRTISYHLFTGRCLGCSGLSILQIACLCVQFGGPKMAMLLPAWQSTAIPLRSFYVALPWGLP